MDRVGDLRPEPPLPPVVAPTAVEVRRYIVAMAVELADLASSRGETALAATLAVAAIQAAGPERRAYRLEAGHQPAGQELGAAGQG